MDRLLDARAAGTRLSSRERRADNLAERADAALQLLDRRAGDGDAQAAAAARVGVEELSRRVHDPGALRLGQERERVELPRQSDPEQEAAFYRRNARALGYESIYWTIDSLDSVGEPKSVPFLYDRIATRSAEQLDGAIVLMHVGYRSTADALPLIITTLQQRGFHLVTVSTLLGTTH
jgi:peptidoglycan/xylan/chitin deacetylase (PgdA/CDA1 family)